MLVYRNATDFCTNCEGFLKFIYFLIGGKLLYNFVLVSAIQKGESVIIVYISLLSWASFLPQPHPSRWSQSSRLGSLCYVATSHQLSILHMIVYICWCYFLYLSHYLLTPLCAQVYSLHLCFHSFLVNNFIGTIFLDSIYMC